MVIVRMRSCMWQITRYRQREFQEKSSSREHKESLRKSRRERDLQRRLLNTGLIQNHSNVFFVEFVITIQHY